VFSDRLVGKFCSRICNLLSFKLDGYSPKPAFDREVQEDHGVRNLLILRILCRLSDFPPSMESASPSNITRVDQFLRVDIIHPHGKIGNVISCDFAYLELAEYGFCFFAGRRDRAYWLRD